MSVDQTHVRIMPSVGIFWHCIAVYAMLVFKDNTATKASYAIIIKVTFSTIEQTDDEIKCFSNDPK